MSTNSPPIPEAPLVSESLHESSAIKKYVYYVKNKNYSDLIADLSF